MTTKRVGNARLLKLAAFLRTVPRKQFDYNVWVGDDWKGAPDLSCGTTACALGWAATMPEFRRLGLHFGKFMGFGTLLFRGDDDPFIGAGEIFSLNGDEAVDLFSPRTGESEATAKQVAKKLERFVAKREREELDDH